MSDETFTYPRDAVDRRNAEFADLKARAEKAEARVEYCSCDDPIVGLGTDGNDRCAVCAKMYSHHNRNLKARAKAAERERDRLKMACSEDEDALAGRCILSEQAVHSLRASNLQLAEQVRAMRSALEEIEALPPLREFERRDIARNALSLPVTHFEARVKAMEEVVDTCMGMTHRSPELAEKLAALAALDRGEA